HSSPFPRLLKLCAGVADTSASVVLEFCPREQKRPAPRPGGGFLFVTVPAIVGSAPLCLSSGMDLNWELKVAGEVGLAMLLGGLVGFEREVAHKPAGFRTHMLVAGAAA